MVKKIQKKISRDMKKTTDELFKNMKKLFGKRVDFMKRAQVKNWVFISVLIVLLGMIVSSKNMNILILTLVATAIHYTVTRNITSALMSGAIIGVLLLLYLRYKTQEMYEVRENLDIDDDNVVTDKKKDGVKNMDLPVTVKGGQVYVKVSKGVLENKDKEEDDKEKAAEPISDITKKVEEVVKKMPEIKKVKEVAKTANKFFSSFGKRKKKQKKAEPKKTKPKTVYSGPHDKRYLPGWAGGKPKKYRSLSEAKRECNKMGDKCGGITYEPRSKGNKKYGLRAGTKLGRSGTDEVSFVKKMADAFTGSKKVIPAETCTSTPATL